MSWPHPMLVNLNIITDPLGIGRLCSHIHLMLGRYLCMKRNRPQDGNDSVPSSSLRGPELSTEMCTLLLLVENRASEHGLKWYPLGTFLTKQRHLLQFKEIQSIFKIWLVSSSCSHCRDIEQLWLSVGSGLWNQERWRKVPMYNFSPKYGFHTLWRPESLTVISPFLTVWLLLPFASHCHYFMPPLLISLL